MVDELPIIEEDSITFEKVLQKIEDYKMAFTLITDARGIFKGIISNADVRRGLLRNIDRMQHINASDLINRKPLQMNENSSIHDLLLFIKQASFPLQYLPVINDENKLTGSILFTNLIKGEL